MEHAPYEMLNEAGEAGLLLVCDHASNAVPPDVAGGDLGLPAAEMERHIAYDIGAAAVTQGLSRALDAPALLSRFSRLVIDPNRGEDDPTLVMRLYDGTIVPANRRVDAAEVERRLAAFHRPYHAAIEAALGRMAARGHTPRLVAIHSFTPRLIGGRPRPWHVGVLWHGDDRMAAPLLDLLRAEPGIVVGENEPYSGQLEGDTMNRHGLKRGLAHVLIEIRHDLIRDPEGQREWAARLAPMLRRIAAGERRTRMDDQTRTELEAAAFRALRDHLRGRTDVQNIDMMNLAGFCRNCLSRWYQEAAAERGIEMGKDEAREIVYGMPYSDWTARHQTEAAPEAKAKFADSH